MKIVSTFPRPVFELGGVSPEEIEQVTFATFKSKEFYAALAEADALFTSSLFEITADIIGAGPKLRLIQTMGVGYNKINLTCAAKKNIFVCNNKSCNSRSVAEFTLSLMLAGLRRLPYYERCVYGGRFADAMKENFVAGLHQLSNRCVGLVGFGDIAKNVARLLSGFGCEIYYSKPKRADSETEREYGVRYLEFPKLISTCNVISLHVPSTPHTIDLISQKEFDIMQPDTLLVNTSRGEVINTPALAKALNEGKIFGAAVDVTYPEPPTMDHPLLNLTSAGRERLIITPHAAGATVESIYNSLSTLFTNARLIDEGKTPSNVVNFLY